MASRNASGYRDVGDDRPCDELLKAPIKVEKGVVPVGDSPGLGLEVDSDTLQRFRLPLQH